MADITIPGIANPNTTKFTGGAQPKFRYVYFAQDVAKGEVQQWSDTAGVLGYGVEDTVLDSTRVAGVACQALDVSVDGYWGWIQTGGYCDYISTDGSVAAPNADTLQGSEFLTATAAEVADGRSAANIDGTAGLYRSVFAMNLAADDASNVGTCILCCHYQ